MSDLQFRAATSADTAAVVALALVLPSIAVLFRRLHDTGRSGWWQLLGIIPIEMPIHISNVALIDPETGGGRQGESSIRGFLERFSGADPKFGAVLVLYALISWPLGRIASYLESRLAASRHR